MPRRTSIPLLASFQGNEEELAAVLMHCRDKFRNKRDVYIALETRFAKASFEKIVLATWLAGKNCRQLNLEWTPAYLINACRDILVSANL